MSCFRFSVAIITVVAGLAQPPATPKKPVTDTYHGIQVTDDYRWLENYSDPAVRAWSDSQNLYARKFLDALPLRSALSEELKKLYTYRTLRYFGLTPRNGVLFAVKVEPPAEQPVL